MEKKSIIKNVLFASKIALFFLRIQSIRFGNLILFYPILWINSAKFKIKKNQADKLHELTGKQYFVVPNDKKGLSVVNNDYIEAYNRNKPKNKRIDYLRLCSMAYYSTGQGKFKR